MLTTHRNDRSHIHQGLLDIQIKHQVINTKLFVYRALIRSITTYACPTLEFVADGNV
jgi:hypothetical protein